MASLILPKNCTAGSLIEAMESAGVLRGDSHAGKIAIQVPADAFVSCSALGVLCAWGLAQRQAGVRLTVIGDIDTQRYLSRMNLFRYLEIDFHETFSRHTEAGRFIPLYLVNEANDVLVASNAICDLVLHQFDNAGDFLPAMEWAVYEIVDNVVTHSDSPVGGVVCAQFYPNRHNLDISICDFGRGIRDSLGERIRFDSHGEAISKALERGMTRNPDAYGRGNDRDVAPGPPIPRGSQGNFHTGQFMDLYQCGMRAISRRRRA